MSSVHAMSSLLQDLHQGIILILTMQGYRQSAQHISLMPVPCQAHP